MTETWFSIFPSVERKCCAHCWRTARRESGKKQFSRLAFEAATRHLGNSCELLKQKCRGHVILRLQYFLFRRASFKRNRKKAENLNDNKAKLFAAFFGARSVHKKFDAFRAAAAAKTLFEQRNYVCWSRLCLFISSVLSAAPQLLSPPFAVCRTQHSRVEAFQIVMQFDNKIWLSQFCLAHFSPF